VTLAMH